MAFVYKVKGRKIELLEKDLYGYYVTPTKTKANALRFEFTARAQFIDPTTTLEWDEVAVLGPGHIDESAIVDIPDYLAKALVYYIKGRLSEDQKDYEGKEYNMHQFQKMLDTHENNKVHGLSQTLVGSWGVK